MDIDPELRKELNEKFEEFVAQIRKDAPHLSEDEINQQATVQVQDWLNSRVEATAQKGASPVMMTEVEVTKVTKVSNEEKNKDEIYWYPAFRLKENPFRYFEAGAEQNFDGIPVIGYGMHEKIKALASAQISCLVVGPRGCGKSSLILSLKEVEDLQIENLEDLLIAVTPKSVSDICCQFYRGLDDETRERAIRLLWRKSSSILKCLDLEKMRCTVCPRSCRVSEPRTESLDEYFAWFLYSVEPPCPAKEKIFHQALREGRISKTVLLDAPDNMSRGESKELASLCSLMLEIQLTLIVFATPGQADLLKKMDTFARFPLVEFERPDTAFFKELFQQRIKGTREGEVLYPFKDEVVEQLASYADYNPREFIKLCGLVLTEMWIRKMDEPCSLDFLKKLNIFLQKPPDMSEALKEALDTLAKEGGWVKVKEIQRTISEKYDLSLDLKSIGRMLSGLGYQKRHNPDAEYLLSPVSG